MKKAVKKLICFVLAAVIVIPAAALIQAGRSSAGTSDLLEELKARREEIAHRKDEAAAAVASLEYDVMSAAEKKALLDERITLTQDEIENLSDQITFYNELIIDKEREINRKEGEVNRLQAQEDEQLALYKVRVRAMEENGSVPYYAIIFGAASFTELLSNIEEVRSIMAYDEAVYEKLLAAEKALSEAKAELVSVKTEYEERRGELRSALDEIVDLWAELEENSATAGDFISELMGDISAYQQYIQDIEADRSRLEQQINEEIERIRKAEEQLDPSTRMIPLTRLQWPIPAGHEYRITSSFGWRLHPVTGEYKLHGGMDIGRVYNNTNVLASDSGVIFVAEYDDVYGNYVMIDHGSGVMTLYAHMSKLKVEQGDTVNVGQIIGITGTTGSSTAPHLHFEVWVDGERTDPADYFTDLYYG